MDPVVFDAGERAAIIAQARRLHAEPPPSDRRGIGCVTVLGTGTLLLLLPPLSKRLGWPQFIAEVLFWLLIIPFALGFFAAFFLATSRYSRASARAGEALAWLASHPGATDAEARRYAVALICYHLINDDGGMSQVVDIDEAKVKLGANLQYVVAVERVLAEEKLSDRYFGGA